jgi:hypothetical protein
VKLESAASFSKPNKIRGFCVAEVICTNESRQLSQREGLSCSSTIANAHQVYQNKQTDDRHSSDKDRITAERGI